MMNELSGELERVVKMPVSDAIPWQEFPAVEAQCWQIWMVLRREFGEATSVAVGSERSEDSELENES
jgi:hypothetical protein